MVLSGDEEMFTPESDPHRSLAVTVCLMANEEETIDPDVQVKEEGEEESPEHRRRRLERIKLKRAGKKECCREGVTVNKFMPQLEMIILGHGVLVVCVGGILFGVCGGGLGFRPGVGGYFFPRPV